MAPEISHKEPAIDGSRLISRRQSLARPRLAFDTKVPRMPRFHHSPVLCIFMNLLPSPNRRRRHKRRHKRPMDQSQISQPHPQGLADGKQAQWQPQFQQPMSGLEQPHPRFAHMPPEGASMPAHTPTQPTPQLHAMYPQDAQGHSQFYGQQVPGHQQGPLAPQAAAQPPQQQAPYGMSTDQMGAAA